MKTWLFLGLAFILTACCGPRYVDFFPCHDDGTPKPQVVLMPIRVPQGCEEGYADVLQQDLRYCLMDHGQLFVFDEEEVRQFAEHKNDEDLFGKDLTWAKSFRNADFIVTIEAMEHRPFNYACGCNMNYVMLKLRLRVIDVRGECPHVVLYELLESCQQVILPRGQEHSTPLQKGSHRLLCEKVVDRMERVIRSCR